jgi:hypothetical protein
MRKNTLPAFHRCQQSAIMTSILYDLDSKKQIRYIADLLFHLCNISLSKLYTDLCNSVAAALNQLLIMGDHKNGSAAPRFAFQFFCDQAHILPVKAAGGFVEDQYPAVGKDGAGNKKRAITHFDVEVMCSEQSAGSICMEGAFRTEAAASDAEAVS